MFKKEQDLAERCRTCLKNKETKKLKTDILAQFPLLEESQLAILFGKNNVTHAKLASRTIIYLVDDIPLFFDHSGRNNLFPTIFTLWLFPNILRNYIIYAPVSSFIIKGADLMLPGLATYTGLEGCKENEKMCVRVHGNPLPFAVGTSLKTWESTENVVRKGRILSVLHSYNDCLSLSNKKSVSNSGFGGTRIYPIENFIDIGGNVLGESNGGLEEEDGDDVVVKGSDDDDNNIERNSIDNYINDNNQQDSVHSDETAEEKLSIHKVDEILQTSLLLSLKYVIKDKQLPLLASSFWALLLR
jgi:translation initiation factor 2D